VCVCVCVSYICLYNNSDEQSLFFFSYKIQCFFSHVMSRMSSRMGQRIVCFMGIIKEVYNTRKKTSVSIPAPLSSVVRLVHDSPEMS